VEITLLLGGLKARQSAFTDESQQFPQTFSYLPEKKGVILPNSSRKLTLFFSESGNCWMKAIVLLEVLRQLGNLGLQMAKQRLNLFELLAITLIRRVGCFAWEVFLKTADQPIFIHRAKLVKVLQMIKIHVFLI
jgi:hypothetical protein